MRVPATTVACTTRSTRNPSFKYRRRRKEARDGVTIKKKKKKNQKNYIIKHFKKKREEKKRKKKMKLRKEVILKYQRGVYAPHTWIVNLPSC